MRPKENKWYKIYCMASCESRQDKPNPALWLASATHAGGMALGINPCFPEEGDVFQPCDKILYY